MARESAGFLSLKGGRCLQNGIKLRQDPWAAQNMFLLVINYIKIKIIFIIYFLIIKVKKRKASRNI